MIIYCWGDSNADVQCSTLVWKLGALEKQYTPLPPSVYVWLSESMNGHMHAYTTYISPSKHCLATFVLLFDGAWPQCWLFVTFATCSAETECFCPVISLTRRQSPQMHTRRRAARSLALLSVWLLHFCTKPLVWFSRQSICGPHSKAAVSLALSEILASRKLIKTWN